MTRRKHLSLASFWFGLYVLYGPVGTNLIPSQVSHLVAKDHYGVALGLVLGSGAFFAMAMPPLVGAWSDRLRTRWGRRRPIIVVGRLARTPGAAAGTAHSSARARSTICPPGVTSPTPVVLSSPA